MVQRNQFENFMSKPQSSLLENITIELQKQVHNFPYNSLRSINSYNNGTTNSFINATNKKLNSQFPYEVFSYTRKNSNQYARIHFKQVRTADQSNALNNDIDSVLNDMKELKKECAKILKGHISENCRLPKLKTESSRISSANWTLKFPRPKVTINVNNEFFINGDYESARTKRVRLPPITAQAALNHVVRKELEEKEELNETGYFPGENSKSNKKVKQEVKTARTNRRIFVIKTNPNHKKPTPKIKDEPIVNVTFSGDQ